MTTSFTLTGDLRDLGIEDPRAMVWVGSNLGGVALVDLDANRILLDGRKRVALSGTAFSISLIATNSTGTNISGGTLRYRVYVDYNNGVDGRSQWTSVDFALTANTDLSDAVASSVPLVLANEYVSKTIVDAKGDLLAGTAADTVGRLPVGANGRQLFADSGQATGLRWGSEGEMPRAVLVPAADFNTYITPGLFFVNLGAVANRPATAYGHLHVSVMGGNQVSQEFTTSQTSTNPARRFLRTSLDSGATWSAWVEVRTSAPLAGNTLTGAGSPEGVVTAPVGTKYVDTAATNGAVEWVKASGGGNTGWRVVYGDTGRRLVVAAGTLTAASGLVMWVQRVNDRVIATISQGGSGTETLTATTPLWAVPAGFRPTPAAGGMPVFVNAVTASDGSGIQHTGRAYIVETATSPAVTLVPVAAKRHYARLQWRTDDAWPTTLPGTAV